MHLVDQELPDLGIVIGVPADWSIADRDDVDAMYVADEEQGYRTSVSLAREALDPPTPGRFEEIIAEVPESLRARHPDLDVVRQLRFAQEGLPAWLLRYRWRSEEVDVAFEQILVLVVADPEGGTLVQVDAVTTAGLADDHLPIIQAMLRTIRPLASDGAATAEKGD